MNNNLREVINGPLYTGKWTIYWRIRRAAKVRKYMKIFWLLMGVTALLAMFGIGMLLAALIAGV